MDRINWFVGGMLVGVIATTATGVLLVWAAFEPILTR